LDERTSQIYEKQLQKANKKSKDAGKSEPLDPIGYYENRYFPYGFDDPNKVLNFHPHHYNAKGEIVE
jgi:hypothetical protein